MIESREFDLEPSPVEDVAGRLTPDVSQDAVVPPGQIARLKSFVRSVSNRVSKSPIGARLARGSFWSLVGNLGVRGFGIIASIVVARLLGVRAFGQVGVIQSTLGLFLLFAESGLGMTATKHVSEFRGKDPERAGRIIGFSLVVGCVTGLTLTFLLWGFAPWIAQRTLAAPELVPLLRIAACQILPGAINGILLGTLVGFESFRIIARNNVVAGLLTLPIMVGGAVWGGTQGVVGAQAVIAGMNMLLNAIAVFEVGRTWKIPLSVAGSAEDLRMLWHYTVPAVLAGVMVGPVFWVCNSVLVNTKSIDGYLELGIYGACNQWFGAILFLPQMIAQISLPIMSESLGLEQRASSSRILQLSVVINLAVVVPLLVVGCLGSPFLIGMYGKEYTGSWLTFCLSLITAGIISIQMPVGNFIVASGKMWVGFAMNVGWAISIIAFTLGLAHWGALGMATSRLFAYLLHSGWTYWYARQILRDCR